MLDLQKTVRKNVIISKVLFEKSLLIVNELGLTYPDYVRMLIAQNVQSKESEALNLKLIDLNEKKILLDQELKKNYNDLSWSNKSSKKKNGHSWKAISTL